MTVNKPKDYLNNANLLREILRSQEIQNQLPEEERDARAAECLTPELVEMLMELVSRFASSYRWRGYTWNDDMQAEARYNLCRVALKFNLEKATASGNPANPFGYYTQIVKRVFLTLIEKEKKQGSIRDEIIEMSDTDLLPSFARQFETETNSLNQDLDGTQDIPSDPRRRRRKKIKVAKEDDTMNMSAAEYEEWIARKSAEFMERKAKEKLDKSE